jgi:alpha-glucoside transport system substrate-binding protein
VAVAATSLIGACGAPGDDADVVHGQVIEVLAVWDDGEAASFRAVLDHFERSSGARVRYTSTEGEDIAEVLDGRLAGSDVPDLAVLPLPSLLEQYATEGVIEPLDDVVNDEIGHRYPAVWLDLATVEGNLYGVWFKAAHKSLVWYDVATFERLGLVPPTDLDGLEATARSLSRAGVTPFALGAGDPWTITDWFENLYLRVAGPEAYDALAERRMPWTHPTVHRTLRLLGRLLAEDRVAGGASGASETTFPQSVRQVFGPGEGPAMLAGGDFVAGFVTQSTDAALGIDADVFLFPEASDSGRLVVGGGDAVVMIRRSPAAEALVRHLAGAEAAQVWAARDGFLSPNQDVSLESYPDERTRNVARSLLEAGDDFRFDLSDLQPAAFGGARGAGMFQILQDFLADPTDVEGTARRLEDAATATAR